MCCSACCISVLQWVAVYCSVLQVPPLALYTYIYICVCCRQYLCCSACCISVLQWVAVRCSAAFCAIYTHINTTIHIYSTHIYIYKHTHTHTHIYTYRRQRSQRGKSPSPAPPFAPQPWRSWASCCPLLHRLPLSVGCQNVFSYIGICSHTFAAMTLLSI